MLLLSIGQEGSADKTFCILRTEPASSSSCFMIVSIRSDLG